jgi:hypothetical protein
MEAGKITRVDEAALVSRARQKAQELFKAANAK